MVFSSYDLQAWPHTATLINEFNSRFDIWEKTWVFYPYWVCFVLLTFWKTWVFSYIYGCIEVTILGIFFSFLLSQGFCCWERGLSVHQCLDTYVPPKTSLWWLVPSFHLMGLGNWTQQAGTIICAFLLPIELPANCNILIHTCICVQI